MANNKKLLPGILLGFLAAALTGTTIAFFTSHDRAVNQVGIGYNESRIEENFPTPTPIIPNENTPNTKVVTVTNTDSVPCYVRVSVSFSDSAIGNAAELLKLNTTDWIFCSETEDTKLGGYYYYKEPLQPGQSTVPLFEGITVTADADFSQKESGDTFEVIVYEESVQQVHYTSCQDAWNQFIRE